jgi:hypothetical protein
MLNSIRRFVFGLNQSELRAQQEKAKVEAERLIHLATDRWSGQGTSLPKGGWSAVLRGNKAKATRIYNEKGVPEKLRDYSQFFVSQEMTSQQLENARKDAEAAQKDGEATQRAKAARFTELERKAQEHRRRQNHDVVPESSQIDETWE